MTFIGFIGQSKNLLKRQQVSFLGIATLSP